MSLSQLLTCSAGTDHHPWAGELRLREERTGRVTSEATRVQVESALHCSMTFQNILALECAGPAFLFGAPPPAPLGGGPTVLTWDLSPFPFPQVTKGNNLLMARSQLSGCEVATKQGTAVKLGEVRLFTCDLDDKNLWFFKGAWRPSAGSTHRLGVFPPSSQPVFLELGLFY